MKIASHKIGSTPGYLSFPRWLTGENVINNALYRQFIVINLFSYKSGFQIYTNHFGKPQAVIFN